MAINNALNLKVTGIVTADGSGGFTGSTVTNHGVVTAQANNTVTSVAPGTIGNVLTSNGTDWVSSTPSGGSFLTVTKTLTSAQVKALHATPIEIIAAPGSGKGIVVVSICAQLNYGGTNAFTAAASQKIDIYYNNTTTAIAAAVGGIVPNGMITSTANKFSIGASSLVSTNQAAGVLNNVNVAAYNPVATEISGNAANNNTIDISVGYWIVTF